MRHTIYKWFWAWDFEKEEAWLNQMSAKGMQLIAVGLCKYIFEEELPDKYIYRLELLNNMPAHPESLSYIRFLEETGAEHIGSILRWVYFRKKAEDGAFDLYSDMDSRMKYYKRIISFFISVSLLNLSSFILNLVNSINFKNPISVLCFLLSLFIFIFLGIGTINLSSRVKRLQKEKVIRE